MARWVRIQEGPTCGEIVVIAMIGLVVLGGFIRLGGLILIAIAFILFTYLAIRVLGWLSAKLFGRKDTE